jgi:hypothetical protein
MGRGRRGSRGQRRGVGSGRSHVQAQRGVDPALVHAAAVQLLEVIRAVDHEACLPERMVQPRTLQLVQVHAHAQVLDGDLLEHLLAAAGA